MRNIGRYITIWWRLTLGTSQIAFQSRFGALLFFLGKLLRYVFFLLFLIALGFHIFVLATGILSTAVDNTVMLYRDLTQMGRLPIEVYQEPLRGFITFIIPVGIMMTYPGQALLGLLSLQGIIIALVFG